MRKTTALALTLLLSGLLATATMTEAADSTAPQPTDGQPPAAPQEETIMVESNVSQAQVDLQVRKMDRRRQVEEAKRLREATIQAEQQQ